MESQRLEVFDPFWRYSGSIDIHKYEAVTEVPE
jgi:hypothetical protein